MPEQSNAAKLITSELFSLNSRDFLRGLIVAGITSAIITIQQLMNTPLGIQGVNWITVFNAAISGIISYLVLKLSTGKQIIVNNPTQGVVDAVKAGAPIEVKIDGEQKTVAQKDISAT